MVGNTGGSSGRILTLVAALPLIAIIVATAPPMAAAQGPPRCELESAVYLSPENWLCLGGTCSPGHYCCLICEQDPNG